MTHAELNLDSDSSLPPRDPEPLIHQVFNPIADMFSQLGTGRVVPACESRLSYVILFMPRSGSTFLTHTLRHAGILGDPDEWFNYDRDAVARLAAVEDGVDSLYSYISWVRRTATSPNGVFGLEISVPQLQYLTALVPLDHVVGSHARWFLLRRRNLVAQAISLYIANSTGRFHSYQDAPADPVYDAEEIETAAAQIVQWEHAAVEFFQARALWPVALFYDDIFDEAKTVALFRNVLQPDGEHTSGVNPIMKVGTSLNASWEARFRSERAQRLAELTAQRPPL